MASFFVCADCDCGEINCDGAITVGDGAIKSARVQLMRTTAQL